MVAVESWWMRKGQCGVWGYRGVPVYGGKGESLRIIRGHGTATAAKGVVGQGASLKERGEEEREVLPIGSELGKRGSLEAGVQ